MTKTETVIKTIRFRRQTTEGCWTPTKLVASKLIESWGISPDQGVVGESVHFGWRYSNSIEAIIFRAAHNGITVIFDPIPA